MGRIAPCEKSFSLLLVVYCLALAALPVSARAASNRAARTTPVVTAAR